MATRAADREKARQGTRPSLASTVLAYLGADVLQADGQADADKIARFEIWIKNASSLRGPDALEFDAQIRTELGEEIYEAAREVWVEKGHRALLGGVLLAHAKLQIMAENRIIHELNEVINSPENEDALRDAAHRIAKLILDPEIGIPEWTVIDAYVRTKLENPDSYQSPLDHQLSLLTQRARLAERVRDQLGSLVDACRSGGATWDQIAQAAGISKQTAHQRWSPDGREKHRSRQRRSRDRAMDSEPVLPEADLPTT